MDFPAEVGSDYYAPDCSGEMSDDSDDDVEEPVRKSVTPATQVTQVIHVDNLNGHEQEHVASVEQDGDNSAQNEAVVHVDNLNGAEQASVTSVDKSAETATVKKEAKVVEPAVKEEAKVVEPAVEKEVKVAGPPDDVEVSGCHVYQGTKASKQIGTIKSITWDTPILIKFENKSSQKVGVYWIDYQGKPVFYNNLEAGRSYEQHSFVTHPWAIYKADGTIQLIEVVEEKVPKNSRFNFDLYE